MLLGAMWFSDSVLWWAMVTFAVVAAGLSVGTTLLGRRATRPVARKKLYAMHLVSYILMTISIAIFVVRGLVVPGP
jgi:phosphate/sulfate permease